ncbi:uncharacterized protein KY384_002139 [Bacidia gigantensis]|uniref:uncharacterized protein n=1 Tax=Bacidia gigantensis TaxID=2732470 RepID=UPI001D03A82E|nr:uncharacterized protein KY384_002139 [Bacidia gigantensis]KAG8533356.1 hypothetical protein KY384_002139 [Bacidia gigantensis]
MDEKYRDRAQSLGYQPGDVRSDSRASSERTLLNMSETELEDRKPKDIEKGSADGTTTRIPAVVTKDHVTPDPLARTKMIMWMAINTLATVFIVFCNKAIFSDPSFGQCQAAFASFHFFVTASTLYFASRPQFQMFTPKWIPVASMMPLAVSMAANIVGMNLSLQISTVTFYQITRVLLTPTVAVINFFFYGKNIPRMAAYALVPMCFGVALISYFDVKPPPPAGAPIKDNGVLGIVVALGSVFISGIYTVWVGSYQRKYDVNGFQLLYNQAPIGAVVLLYVVPWTDKFPALDKAPINIWYMILFSGVMASLINISQFYIIIGAGPVESTVVGHLKTCVIVIIGAFTGGRIITVEAAMGIMLALLSIFG